MQPVPAISSRPKKTSDKRKSTFFVWMGVVCLIVVIAGFLPTYISPMMSGTFVAKPFVHFHGIVFFSWILIGIVQPLLVNTGNTRLHRKVGLPMGIFAALVLFMGIFMALTSARIDVANGEGRRPLEFLLIPLTDMILFALFVGLALYNYKRPEYHKRLMLLATVSILPAAFGRLLGVLGIQNLLLALFIMNSFVLVAILNDLFRGKPLHRVYLFGGLLIILIQFARFFLSKTSEWVSIAGRLIQ